MDPVDRDSHAAPVAGALVVEAPDLPPVGDERFAEVATDESGCSCDDCDAGVLGWCGLPVQRRE
jgi:hypothetical protein